MREQQWFIQQVFSGLSVGWISVLLCSGLFVVILFKPERIGHRAVFRWACTLFAMSIIVLAVMSQLRYFAITPQMRNQGWGNSGIEWFDMLSATLGPIFVGFSLMLAFAALMPPAPRWRPQLAEPVKHPLDP